MEVLGQAHELLPLPLDELRDRDSRPARDHLGDVLLVDLLLVQRPATVLAGGELALLLRQPPLELGELPVAQLGDLVQVVFALGLGDLVLRLLDLFPQPAERTTRVLLRLPAQAERLRGLAQLGDLLLETSEPLV